MHIPVLGCDKESTRKNCMKFILKTLVLAVRITSVSAHADTLQTLNVQEGKPAMDILETTSRKSTQVLFYECAAVVNDSARLACFDNVAQGNQPSVLKEKLPLDLSRTVVSTIKGNPQAVLVQKQIAYGSDKIEQDAEKYTPLSLTYDLDKNSPIGLWKVRPHNPTYILPLFVNGKPNRNPSTPNQEVKHYSTDEMRGVETKMQVSMKVKAVEDLFGTNADLWMGYTQQSHWQVYNENNSRPFRASDYRPEIFVTQPVSARLPFGGKLRMIGAGAEHHSNGEKDPLSRSWNKAYLMGGMEWGKLTVIPRIWTRFANKDSNKPDDNPDIQRYYGHGDIQFIYQLGQGSQISGLGRLNPATGKGALQLDYVYPLGRGISGYVQVFQGYGQSIVDYNHETTVVGVGIMLNDWIGL